MRKLSLFILTVLCLFSCTEHNPDPEIGEQDPDWIRLEIPFGREAYAIAGDIDQTLLVTTWTKAYYTSDRGKTWHESKNFNGPVPGLLIRNDTTFSLEASGDDAQGNRYASLGQYFTADYGKTWHYYSQYYNESALRVTQPIGVVQSLTGTAYSIKQNTTPTSPTSTSYYINPSEILKEDATGPQLIRFPFRRSLINLYLDLKNRLYVAASGGIYEEENNTFLCCADEMPAVVYVSKKPLP